MDEKFYRIINHIVKIFYKTMNKQAIKTQPNKNSLLSPPQKKIKKPKPYSMFYSNSNIYI